MIRYIQAVNFAFIVPSNILTYLYILYIYRYYSDNHPFRKTSQLEDHCYEPFWVILWLIFVMLFHFLRSVQPFIINVYIDVFCITPILFTAQNFVFHTMSFFAGTHFGVFFSLFCSNFSLFLENCFHMKFCTYIIDNILLVYRLKIFMEVLSFSEGYFDFLGGRVADILEFYFLFSKNFTIF